MNEFITKSDKKIRPLSEQSLI